MSDDLEDRLRRALDQRAARVTPDPNTWRKVEARIQRGRGVKLAWTGAVVAAVTLLAGITVLPLVNGTRVGFNSGGAAVEERAAAPLAEEAAGAGTAAESAAADSAIQAPAVPLPGPCGGRAGVLAVVATVAGDLRADCVDGSSPTLTEGAIDAHPVLNLPYVLFDRRTEPDGPATLMELDLNTGAVEELWPGAWPAVGPDGQIAAIVDTPGDGVQPEIEVVIGDTNVRFPVAPADAPEVSARHLAIDPAGDRVYWEHGYEGSATFTATLDPPHEPVRLEATGDGATLVAPISDEPGTVTAIDRCCVQTEGDRPTSAMLVSQTRRGTVGEHDLIGLENFDYTAPELFLEPAGETSWLVGDGQRVFIVGEGFRPELFAEGATSAVIVPPETDVEGPMIGLATVQVYFPKDDACGVSQAVARTVQAPAVLRGALEALLAGPTDGERAQGYGGVFSAATAGALRDVRLDAQGVAHVDFDDLRAIIPTLRPCEADVVLDQLDRTVHQFPNVTGMRFSILGSEAAFEEWLATAR